MYTRNVGETYSPNSQSVNSPSQVRFGRDDYSEERKKYLTAKYGQHQMRLIRKRLAVEDWVDTELRRLYGVEDDSDTYDCEIDVDELLDLDNDSEKRQFLQTKLANLKQSPEVVNKFVADLLEKAQTL
jgi:protein phosphatase 1 regulatory subunit 14B